MHTCAYVEAALRPFHKSTQEAATHLLLIGREYFSEYDVLLCMPTIETKWPHARNLAASSTDVIHGISSR